MVEKESLNTIKDVAKNIEDENNAGDVLGKLLERLNTLNNEKFSKKIKDLLLSTSIDITTKSNPIQRALINRIIINKLLTSETKNVADIILVCNLTSTDNIWIVNMVNIVFERMMNEEELNNDL